MGDHLLNPRQQREGQRGASHHWENAAGSSAGSKEDDHNPPCTDIFSYVLLHRETANILISNFCFQLKK